MTVDQARLTAVWYAWGQQDAGIGHNVDAQEFAKHYERLAAQPSRPSVQDAWRAYISDAAMASAQEALAAIPNVAAFTPEIEGFLTSVLLGGSTNIVCDSFAPAVGDPGHCAICGQYDSDHYEVDEDAARGDR